MCLVFVAKNYHPKYKFIILANRDEFYDRETELANLREDSTICGIDKKAGGTWLGINQYGNFAVVTNYRDGQNEDRLKKSRGILIKNHLNLKNNIENQDLNTYKPLNVLYGDKKELYYTSNSNSKINRKKLPKGIYGLSNASLNSDWPKLNYGKTLFDNMISEKQIHIEKLFQIMQLKKIFPDHSLPKTNVPIEWERILSSPFIHSETYGTRSTTLILINKYNQVEFIEKSYNKLAEQFSEKYFRLDLV
jgi:uncharacterized protein with NRDE domain